MPTPVLMFVQALDGGAALAMAMLVAGIATRSRAGLDRVRNEYLHTVVTSVCLRGSLLARFRPPFGVIYNSAPEVEPR